MLLTLFVIIIVFIGLFYLMMKFSAPFFRSENDENIKTIQKKIDNQNELSKIQNYRIEVLKASQENLEKKLDIIFDSQKIQNITAEKHQIFEHAQLQFLHYICRQSKNLLQMSHKFLTENS